jgi:hypothetical protein
MDVNIVLIWMITLWSGVYAISFGLDVFRNKNYVGGIFIGLLVLSASLLMGFVTLR